MGGATVSQTLFLERGDAFLRVKLGEALKRGSWVGKAKLLLNLVCFGRLLGQVPFAMVVPVWCRRWFGLKKVPIIASISAVADGYFG